MFLSPLMLRLCNNMKQNRQNKLNITLNMTEQNKKRDSWQFMEIIPILPDKKIPVIFHGKLEFIFIYLLIYLSIPGWETLLQIKGKVCPCGQEEGPNGQQRYSSTHSLPLALEGDGWLMPCPDHFTPGKETQYPLYRTTVRSWWQYVQAGKILPLLRSEPWAI